MKKKNYTIYLKKTDFNFVQKEVNIIDFITFTAFKELNKSHYEIKISESELMAFAEERAHACDYIKSDRKAQRMNRIAMMLDCYLDGF